MTTMTISQILNVMPKLPASSSVLLRGNHGIGKSSIARQVNRIIQQEEGHESYPVIDRRLSQTTQGDIIGLPKMTEESTKWLPPDWYLLACKKPCTLFLDELNRAEPEVLQAAFQIVLDRELNGHKLHPQTRVYAAINTQSNYNVNQIDPALLDRFFVMDVFFRTQDWLVWAKKEGISQQIIDFIAHDDVWLLPPSGGAYDAESVHPSPRSWEFVNNNIKKLLSEGEETGTYDREAIRLLMLGHVGNEAAIKFTESLRDAVRFTGEDVFNSWSKLKAQIDTSKVDIMNDAIDKVAAASQKMKKVTKKQGENLKQFFWDLPAKDLRVVTWQKMAQGEVEDRIDFLRSINDFIADALLDVFGVPRGEAGIGVLPNVPGLVVNQADNA